MMTEDEAKTKWCPLANAHGDSMLRGTEPSGKLVRDWQHTLCIGSACMAWRWLPEMSIKDGILHAGDVIGGQPVEMGYCGAFGKPGE